MKLYYSSTSPYSRKVRLVVIEKGLSDQIKMVLCNPFDDVLALKAANPLGKIPALVLEDGSALYDSPVICEYLDSLSPNNRLIPETGPARWDVLRWQALADGILDAAYNIVMERRRPESEQSAQSIVRWRGGIEQALDGAESQILSLPESVNLAYLALVSALGYLDFRLSELAWRTGRDSLAEWYEQMSHRPSVVVTQPGG